ncbi:hypothetical protein Taro_034788 [Colocasia esculenta]|uniref:Uncharacterized protein n=1 Tax=Colocasia esculenta TaxID=4460 RepID=A0A843W4X2_COLES|nr:hypothetical protein [Colocasia esculenta]
MRQQINNHTEDTRNLSWFGPSHMEVLRPVPKQPLGILLTKGTVPLKDNTTPSTPAGLLLFPSSTFSRNNNIITYLYYLPQIKVRRQPTSFTSQEANLLIQTPVQFC